MTKRFFKFTDGTRTVFRATSMPRGFKFGVLSPTGWIAFANTTPSIKDKAYPAFEITQAEFNALVAAKKARVIAAGGDNVSQSSPQDAWVFNAEIEVAA